VGESFFGGIIGIRCKEDKIVANSLSTLYRFQMVSLLKLAKVTEEGVRFLSPHDGTPMYEFISLMQRDSSID